MADEQKMIQSNGSEKAACCINLESMNRIAKLPVVESTYQTGKNIYDKVKDYNSVTNWTISTAESTVSKAVEMGRPIAAPVVHSLEGPIKKVDDLICCGIDYVESKMPAVKLPPSEMYTTTKDYIASSPTVQTACAIVKPAVESAKETAMNTVQSAKNIVEPAVQSAKNIVEPAFEGAMHNIVEPAMQSAKHIVDPVVQKVEEYLHPTTQHEQEEDGSVECVDCNNSKQQAK